MRCAATSCDVSYLKLDDMQSGVMLALCLSEYHRTQHKQHTKHFVGRRAIRHCSSFTSTSSGFIRACACLAFSSKGT